MNKKLKTLVSLLLALIFIVSATACVTDDVGESSDDATQAIAESGDDTSGHENIAMRDPDYKALNYDNMKAMWISQYDTKIFAVNGKQRDKKNYTQRVEKIMAALTENGFNTVILQIRPFGDSYYPSEVFCPSSFAVGAYGKEFVYDPFKIFIDIAHEYNLSVHAWINPLRLMTEKEIETVSVDYKIGEWYQDTELRAKYLRAYKNRYYLLPVFDETRKLVADGVTEICTNYNVDAVHIDDYFYPTADPAFDKAHYETVEDEYASLSTYRLENVNKLVHAMYQAVKAVDEDILFGISPAGSISYNYNTVFADVRSWCSKTGFCDYIVPQVYWGFEHTDIKSRFDVCTEGWEEICKEPSVRLIIGMGIYRATDGEFDEFANNKDVFKRQLEYLKTRERVSGFVMFSYQDMFDDYGRYSRGLTQELENFLPVLLEY